jgi:hypothetical protein
LQAAYDTKRAYQRQISATEDLVKSQFFGRKYNLISAGGGMKYA